MIGEGEGVLEEVVAIMGMRLGIDRGDDSEPVKLEGAVQKWELG